MNGMIQYKTLIGVLDAFVVVIDACCIWGCDVAAMTFSDYGSLGCITWLSGTKLGIVAYLHLSLFGLVASLFYFILRLNGVIDNAANVKE